MTHTEYALDKEMFSSIIILGEVENKNEHNNCIYGIDYFDGCPVVSIAEEIYGEG